MVRIMTSLLVVLATIFLAHFPNGISSKKYSRCELAWEMHYIHNVPINQVPMYVCIAQKASNYTTHTTTGDCYGILRICKGWCSMATFSGGGCKILCSDLLDDSISDDINCAKVVSRAHLIKDKDMFRGWGHYYDNCKANAKQYVEGCFGQLT